MLFMENSPRTDLSEIMALAASIREQLMLLETKLAELQNDAENGAADVPVDIFQEAADLPHSVDMMPEDLEDLPEDILAEDDAVYGDGNEAPAVDASESEQKEGITVSESGPERTEAVPVRESGPERQEEILVPENAPEGKTHIPEREAGVLAMAAEDDMPDSGAEGPDTGYAEDDMLFPFDGDGKDVPPSGGSAPLSVMDVMSEKEAWRKDMPGQPVRDVRSAISLNDRASFIRTLFREDPLLFSGSITDINNMETLAEVEAYLKKTFPEWDMESDAVYRFMMAVRRKVR